VCIRTDVVVEAFGGEVIVAGAEAPSELDLLRFGLVRLALALPFGPLGGDVEISDEPSSFEAGTLRGTTIDAATLRASGCWWQRGAQERYEPSQQSQSRL